MESFLETFRNLDTSQTILYGVGGAAVTVVSLVAIRKLTLKEKREDYPRDTVILHQPSRGPYAPSVSPFVVKLETYLRMARIPYQNVFGMKHSPKGKFPWIEYNGQPIGDSTLCIQFLNQKLGVDLNKHLSPADKGIAQAMQVMTEEHLCWFLALIRWVYSRNAEFILEKFKLRKFIVWMVRRNVKKQAWNQGLGRHTEEEIVEMMNKDIQSLSDFIARGKCYTTIPGDKIKNVESFRNTPNKPWAVNYVNGSVSEHQRKKILAFNNFEKCIHFQLSKNIKMSTQISLGVLC
ncbi:failed axon connections homolog isoform X2 [Haliotis rufescens]|uniref:failed axon connections homolog isoform X2 n=1 Tax=Haliotis rufescens TaxID=6454 RepID=UPI00201F21B2|nr:failed axon connections homolog isoform X2 [Haliotis rufescens]